MNDFWLEIYCFSFYISVFMFGYVVTNKLGYLTEIYGIVLLNHPYLFCFFWLFFFWVFFWGFFWGFFWWFLSISDMVWVKNNTFTMNKNNSTGDVVQADNRVITATKGEPSKHLGVLCICSWNEQAVMVGGVLINFKD